VVKKG